MAAGLNRVFLIGNVGQPPESNATTGGTSVLKIRLATNERRKEKDGTWKDFAEWHTVVIFGKRADALSSIVAKGSQLFIEGRIQTRDWVDKQGQKRWTTEIIANDVKLLGSKRERSSSGSEQSAPRSDTNGYGDDDAKSGGYGFDDYDDIPF